MRKAALILICMLALAYCLLPPAATLTANADEVYEWVRVTEEGVFLYANNYSSKVLCILQKSYYLRVVSRESEMLLVSIMGDNAYFPAIVGYVWASQVKNVKSTPLTPYYPTETLTVCADSAAIMMSPVPSSDTLLVAPNTQRLSFYGEIISYGETWYYVYCGGKFGYVRTSQVTSPNIAPHPTPLEDAKPVVNPDPSEPADREPTVTPATSGAEIILIVFVVLFALGLALAVILPGNVRHKGANDVFDKNI